MTRNHPIIGPLARKMACAATLCAALFLCVLAAPLSAQDDPPETPPPHASGTVTVSRDGFAVSGEILGYDGTFLRLQTPAGEVSLDMEGAACEGALCPDPQDYVPRLRLSGPGRLSGILLPALIDGYARETGLRATRRDIDDTRFEYDIEAPETGLPVLRFAFRVGSSAAGFDDLATGRADVALADREITEPEAATLEAAGLGRMREARRSEIVALDALIPVVSPRRRIEALPLSALARIFAGAVTDWGDLGRAPGPIALHLPAQDSGLSHGVRQMLLDPAELSLAESVTFHADPAAMAEAVAADVNAIGIAGFAGAGRARPLAIGGCGLPVGPDILALKTEDYPLTQPMFLYLPERRIAPEAQAWINWLRSAAAQRIVRRAGFVDRGAAPVPLARQGNRLARAVMEAGDEVALNDLQAMLAKLMTRTRLTTTFRFTPGSTRLDAQSRSNLMQLARWLRDGELQGRHLTLIGFSDGRGPAEANRTLSLARAESVRRALLAVLGGALPEGVTLEIDAFGEALPMACDDTAWGRQTNRRVELWVAEARPQDDAPRMAAGAGAADAP